MAGPRITDVSTLLQAGINPKTGLPIKMGDSNTCELKGNIKKVLRVIDEQTAINRFKWYNLPQGLNSQLLERVLYYKGQGAFFYMPTDEKFYFLPYALDGTIDVYGRFTGITPLPFAGGTTKTSDGKDKPWITGLRKYPKYDIQLEEVNENIFENSCVLLKDYSPQYSETIISRQILNDPLLDTMSECIPFMRTALIAGTGIKGMRVDDADQEREVNNAAHAITDAALSADMFVPIVAPVELQELTPQNLSKSEEYMLALQSLDNFRLSTYGLENGGLFQKKQQMLQSEQEMNGGNVGLVYQDSLSIRQHFCDIVNSIWGLKIWCEQVETNEANTIERDDINESKEEVSDDYSSGSNDSTI